jgi:hypothetical protein
MDGGSSTYAIIELVPTNPQGDFSSETYWRPDSHNRPYQYLLGAVSEQYTSVSV